MGKGYAMSSPVVQCKIVVATSGPTITSPIAPRWNAPAGQVKFLTTIELEPTTDGTIVHTRFAAAKTARERAMMKRLLPMFAEFFNESDRSLTEQLEVDINARNSGRSEEPALPTPRPDGLLSAMPPLIVVA
jgi:hypothetical protein